MRKRNSPQLTITLSKKAYEQYEIVAKWKQIPLATLIRQILEREQESEAFSALFKQATADE